MAERDEETIAVDASGQITLPLGDAEYVLRPSYAAIEAVERQLRPLFQLAQDAATGALSIGDMATIAVELMKAHGATLDALDPAKLPHSQANPDKVARLIMEAGVPRILVRLMAVLHGALNGGYTAEGEAKAGTTESIPAGE